MKNKNVSILKKIIWTIMTAAFLTLLPTVSSFAEETEGSEVLSGTLMVTTESVTIRTEAKNSADELATIPEGNFVLVTGQTDDGWFVVGYHGQIGYFKGKGKEPVKQDSSAVNVDELNQEMEQQAVQSLFLGEEMIQYQESKHKALFWAISIGIAIVGVFVAAIISGKRKEEKETEDKKTPEVVAVDSDDIPENGENASPIDNDEFENMTIEFDLEEQDVCGIEKRHDEGNNHHDIDVEEENEMNKPERELKIIDLDNLCEDSL